MAQNLSNLYISESFGQLVQVTGSTLANGLGGELTDIDITASNADFATTASYALNAESVDTGSFMITGSASGQTLTFEKGDGTTFDLEVAATGAAAESLVTASVSDATITFEKGDASTFDIIVNNVSNATSAGSATTATSASHALQADNAAAADSATTATTASYVAGGNVDGAVALATSATSATTATTASHATSIPSNLNITASGLLVNGTGSFDILTAASASFGYLESITGSAKIIGDAFIILNNDTPTERYAGVKVIDSGSTGATASLQFDGQTNDWFYEYTASGDPLNHGVIMFGPEYGTIGSPTYPTANTLVKGNGGHHLEDSSITDDGTNVTVSAHISASGDISASAFFGDGSGLTGVASAGFPHTGSAEILGNLVVDLSGSTDAYTVIDGVNSGSLVDNLGDIYTGSDAVKHVITLTQAEYNAISASADTETLYYITDAPSFATSASYAVSASEADHAVSADSATSATTATSASFASSVGTLPGITVSGSSQFTGSFEVLTKVGGGAETFGVEELGGAGIRLLSKRNFSVLSLGTNDNQDMITMNYNGKVGIFGSGDASGTPYQFATDEFKVGVPIALSGSASGLEVTGSTITSLPVDLTISSLTASMDCSTGNFFNVTLVNGVDTHIDASNIQAGTTYNLKVTQGGAGTGTISFSGEFAFPTGSTYTGSAVASAVDIVSAVAFDNSNLYANQVENLV